MGFNEISDLSTEGAIKALLAELNDEQKKAVQAGDEPLLIFAGAGKWQNIGTYQKNRLSSNHRKGQTSKMSVP